MADEAPSPSPSRVVWVQLDGLGDLSVEKYGHRTPLCEAFTPFLDLLARAGSSGLCDPVEPGLACGEHRITRPRRASAVSLSLHTHSCV